MVKKIGVVVALVGLILVGLNYKTIVGWFLAAKTVNASEVKLLLPEDPTFESLLVTLKEKKVINDFKEVRKIAREIQLDTTALAGGKYIILPGAHLEDLLKGFRKGKDGRGEKELLVKVYFNTCRDLNDVSGSVSKCISADSASLFNRFVSVETLQKYGFSREQMPALILPMEYEMEYDTNADEFIEFMASKFREFWTEERLVKLKKIGLNSQSQAVTLASIVYSEQGRVQEEWPIIAGLYVNRIQQGIPLQSDPTFKFCWGHALDNVQVLNYKHRDIDCSYNTYKINGLPPGPICITPAKVVDAVLNAADVDYIYMCAKPDNSGTHNFTDNLTQHNANATAYRNWMKKQTN